MRALLALAFLASAAPAFAQPAAQLPAGCHAVEQRQFDFWLGEWNVSPSGDSPVMNSKVIAESSIILHDQGCVIL